ncbi:MAG: hypothetical protein RQM92_07340 [Candidatus Syntrophopropionicum ammoniitolerans]
MLQVEERVGLCLNQNPCFYKEKDNWRLDLEGNKENDQFYSLLLRRGRALNLKEILKNPTIERKNEKNNIGRNKFNI